MSTLLYQVSCTITSSDGKEQIDTSNLFSTSMDLSISQKNVGYRGINNLTNRGESYINGIDSPNTWELHSKFAKKEDYVTLLKWFKEATKLNITIVFRNGELKGIKKMLDNWWLSESPMQKNINGNIQDTVLKFEGFLWDVIVAS